MIDRERYGAYLKLRVNAPHFSVGELVVSGAHNRQLPPEILWSLMIETLDAAEELRERMRLRCEREGWQFSGLRVAAAYRPRGGAKDSQHKRNRALDLDLMFVDWDPARVGEERSRAIRQAWYEVAVAWWWEHRNLMRVGLGLYCGVGKTYGVRVHIDVGYSSRTWQGVGASFATQPATFKIAKRLGLQ